MSNRTPLTHPSWRPLRKPFGMAVLSTALLFLFLFLGMVSYLFGASYGENERVKNIKVLVVDYDGGAIGQAIENVYPQLAGDTFPTFEFVAATEYPEPAQVRSAVCKGKYWGAVYTHAGASDRLWDAVRGEAAAAGYDAADAVTCIYNQVRYAAVSDGILLSNLKAVTAASRSAYYATPNGTAALAGLDRNSTAAVQAFLNPIDATFDYIKPMAQGSRVFLNTVGMVMPILAQFFFLMPFTMISGGMGVLARGRIRDVYLLRLAVGTLYTLLASLVFAGYVWAFRETFALTGAQFGVTWMVVWLFMNVNWVFLDTVFDTVVPLKVFSPFMLTWILMNVASTIMPFELTPGFYKLGYALPAREAWGLLVTVWSGCWDREYVALPVLFSWFVVFHAGSAWSTWRRCTVAEREAAAAAAAAKEKEKEKEDPVVEGLEEPTRSDIELGRVQKKGDIEGRRRPSSQGPTATHGRRSEGADNDDDDDGERTVGGNSDVEDQPRLNSAKAHAQS